MKTQHWIFLSILLFFLAVQGYLFYYYDYVWWDSGVYLGMAKHLYSSGEVGLWENIRPPFLPLFLGIFWKAGLPFLLTARVIAILFSLATLFLIYKLGKQFSGWSVGTLSVALLATSATYLFLSSQVLSDIPSLLLALLGILFLIQEHTFFSGLFIGLSFLTRFPQGFMLCVAGAYLLLSLAQKQQTLKEFLRKTVFLGTGFALPIFIYLITNKVYFHSFLGPIFHAMEVIQTAPPNYVDIRYFYLVFLFLQIYLFPFAVVSIYDSMRKKRYSTLILLLLPCVFYFIYFALKESREPRYLLIFLPYFCILTAQGLEYTFSRRRWIIAQLILVSVIISLLFLRHTLSQPLTDFGPYNAVEYKQLAREHYSFLSEPGFVLTTHPALAAFTDHKLLVMYREPFDEAYGKYFRRSGVKYAYINECDLVCYDDSEKCLKDRTDFIYYMTHNHLLLNRTYGQCRYYLIKKA